MANKAQIASDILGWLGALLFLIAYFLIIIKNWKSTDLSFHICNILGGICLGINCWYYHSIPGAFINLTWAAIACYGLYKDQLLKK